MIKQKKNQELRSSLRILLGAIFLLAMAPASLRAKDAPVPSNGKITVDASEAVSEEMTQEEAEALEKGLVEADKAGQLDRSLVEELSDGTEPEGTAKGIGWQYRKLAERSGESTLDIVVSRLDKIEGILDAIQAAQAAKDLGRAQELLDEESPLENIDQLSQEVQSCILALEKKPLTGEQEALKESSKERLAKVGVRMDDVRAQQVNLKTVFRRDDEHTVSTIKLDKAMKGKKEADEFYAAAAHDGSEARLERAKENSFNAQKSLLEATGILAEMRQAGSDSDQAVKKTLIDCAELRLRLQSRLAEVFSLLGQKNPEMGEAYLSVGILELQLALARNVDQANEALANAADFIDMLGLDEHFQTEVALVENCSQSDFIPDRKSVV